MGLKQRLDRLEAISPSKLGALAVFITTCETRGPDEDESRNAQIIWPGGQSLSLNCAAGEAEGAFIDLVRTMEGLPFEAAKGQLADFETDQDK